MRTKCHILIFVKTNVKKIAFINYFIIIVVAVFDILIRINDTFKIFVEKYQYSMHKKLHYCTF